MALVDVLQTLKNKTQGKTKSEASMSRSNKIKTPSGLLDGSYLTP